LTGTRTFLDFYDSVDMNPIYGTTGTRKCGPVTYTDNSATTNFVTRPDGSLTFTSAPTLLSTIGIYPVTITITLDLGSETKTATKVCQFEVLGCVVTTFTKSSLT
jgi:hypothetical protein